MSYTRTLTTGALLTNVVIDIMLFLAFARSQEQQPFRATVTMDYYPYLEKMADAMVVLRDELSKTTLHVRAPVTQDSDFRIQEIDGRKYLVHRVTIFLALQDEEEESSS